MPQNLLVYRVSPQRQASPPGRPWVCFHSLFLEEIRAKPAGMTLERAGAPAGISKPQQYPVK